jgi:formylglycine-generating enzyme required for sulfatase activity
MMKAYSLTAVLAALLAFLPGSPSVLAQTPPPMPNGAPPPLPEPSRFGAFKECAKDCPEMVVIPAGSFVMGSPDGENGRYDVEGPQHDVVFAQPFAVSRFDVTFDDWDACAAYGDCDPHASDSGFGRGRQPVINVTWDDAKQYAAWLSRITGKPYRLLSEAEWEYAARAGTRTAYSFGDDESMLDEYAWYSPNSGWRPHPVGEKKPNAFGLYDMHGNVWQWVEDCWHENYAGEPPKDGSAWIAKANCAIRVVRGGSRYGVPQSLRSAHRLRSTTDSRVNLLGFRVGRTLIP